MVAYVVRRLLIMPLIVLGVSVLIFGMLQFLSPYERVGLYVREIPHQAGAIDELVEKYGLDDPVPVQYLRWMSRVVRGDLGYSQTGKRPVLKAILHFFPASVELAILSIVPIVGIGLWMGILSAVHQDKLIDHISRVVSIIGWSFPTFLFGIIVLMIFYAKLDWFPAGRLSQWANQIVYSAEFTKYTGLMTIDSLLNGRIDIFLDALRHLVLPVITLSYLSWALILRVTRSSMLNELRADYVTTARAKGLRERVVVNKHVRPNALIPVATIGGLIAIGLMSGVVVTETVFNYPGIGRFFVTAALQLDVIAVLGFTLFYGVMLIVGNLVVDVMYGYLDPRVRLE